MQVKEVRKRECRFVTKRIQVCIWRESELTSNFLLLGGSKLHDYRISLFLCSEVSHFVLESKLKKKSK
ncbi:hypothetical protein CWO24_24445 [Vibrio sp. 10N.286.46.E10]|nr:hypothetical protein CWO24_24445 [Vibrio sp. 10N.286.46.E10]